MLSSENKKEHKIKKFFKSLFLEDNMYFSILLSVILFLILMTVLCQISHNWINTISLIRNLDTDLCKSLIGITFTIMGFSITIRNIIISRDMSSFSNFSLKNLIDENTSYFDKFIWYLILFIPIHLIIIYIIGYRKQIYVFAIISGLSMILYFFCTLRRLKRISLKETIVNILIDNMLIERNIEYSLERKKLINQLCYNQNKKLINVEHTELFKKYLKNLQEIVANRSYRKLFKGNLIDSLFYWKIFLPQIERKINYTLKSKNDIEKKEKLILSLSKEVSLYTFDYFNIFLNDIKKNNKIPEDNSVYLSAYIEELFEQIITDFKEIQNKKHLDSYFNYNFVLFMNITLGIVVSCLINFNFNFTEKILKELVYKVNSDDYLFRMNITSYINALIAISIKFVCINNYINVDTGLLDLNRLYNESLFNTTPDDIENLYIFILKHEFKISKKDTTIFKQMFIHWYGPKI